MKEFKKRIEKFIESKPSQAEVVVSYSLLGLSSAGLLTILVLVAIQFVQ